MNKGAVIARVFQKAIERFLVFLLFSEIQTIKSEVLNGCIQQNVFAPS